MDDAKTIQDLVAIMARLRAPEGGCPWDRRQTFATILPYTLEEAYEVAEAIENEDMRDLRDELGDLLFQVVFHARMAEEQGSFRFSDVVEGICDKMIRRHPHVFGEADFADEQQVGANWEREKAAERARKRQRPHAGILDGVAQSLPALVRAEKLQRRAAGVGFDWNDVRGVLEKVREELAECAGTLGETAEVAERVHEVGDLLFSCVNLARHMGVDAEQALRAANHRFERRFGQVEAGLRSRGSEPGPDVRDEMERLWEAVKAGEG
ncbi:MAG: nucleoside triphosphate pyrophosphohydrolase [Chromatiaceae bacterium]